MSPPFSLATVLRLREIADEREERLLGNILHQLIKARQSLEQLKLQRQAMIQGLEVKLRSQVSSAELQMDYGRIKTCESLQVTAEQNVVKLETARLEQMKVYEAAHQRRELLTGMRDEQRQLARKEEARLEQNNMDDNYSARRGRR